jgi:hypothetical protein
MDMVKLRMQNTKPSPSLTAYSLLADIWKAGGIRELYKGIYPTAAGYLPAWMIYFTVYDSSKRYFNDDYCLIKLTKRIMAMSMDT